MKYVEGYTSGENTAAKNDISTSDLIHFCGNWIWRAVEALVQAKDFNPNPAWIADRLNISAVAASEALEGLERIGMIVKTEGGYVGSEVLAQYKGGSIDRSDRFEIHNKIKEQISNRTTSRDCYANAVFLSSKVDINDFYKKFCGLVEELNNKALSEGTGAEVYAMELSLARLTREQK